MAKNTRLAKLAVNTEANAFGSLLNGGYIEIYDGEQPESADLPVTDQTRGVTLRFGDPAFAEAVDGVIMSNPITAGVAVTDINPATWARLYTAARKVVMDVSVGKSNANVVLPTVNIAAGVTVSCGMFSHFVSKSTPGS